MLAPITPAPITAEVDVTELMGNEIYLYLLTGKKSFIARVDPRTRFTHLGLQPSGQLRDTIP